MAVRAHVLVKPRDVESKARHYVLWQYGPSFDIGRVERERQGYHVAIDAAYQETVRNARTSQAQTFLHRFDGISSMFLDESAVVKEAPSPFALKKSIIARLRARDDRVEREVIRAGKRKVGGLLSTRTMFTPLVTVIAELLAKERDVPLSKFPTRYAPQIELLRMAEYARIDRLRGEDAISPTEKWASLFKQLHGEPVDFRCYLLGDILFNHYDYIVGDLQINQFMPFTRISASYYSPALRVGGLIPMEVPDLMGNYFEVHHISPARNEGRFYRYLDELTEREILMQEDNYVLGAADIFGLLSKSVSPPGGRHAAVAG